jgi:hypothetical protein
MKCLELNYVALNIDGKLPVEEYIEDCTVHIAYYPKLAACLY